MSDKSYYDGIKHVVRIIARITQRKCEHCDFANHEFEEFINHYIEQHGYKLLHVGNETLNDPIRGRREDTVAVLGV